MDPQILGFVMARNEWPLLGVAVVHALSVGVDHVVVVDHASTDNSADGLHRLAQSFPGRLTIIRLEDERFFQEAATSLMTELVNAKSYDWVYVFDADEFILVQPGSTLKDILSSTPGETEVVRYQVDQWIAPTDMDDLNVKEYERVRHRAVPTFFKFLHGEELADEIEAENLNFYDIPFLPKIIVRSHLAYAISSGAHLLKTSRKTVELALDSPVLRTAHLPFLSRRRLDVKRRHGQAMRDAGQPKRHGWQSQMLSRMDDAGQLDDFWSNHSLSETEDHLSSLGQGATTVIDDALADVMARAVVDFQQSMDNHHGGGPADSNGAPVSDVEGLWLAAMTTVHRRILDYDERTAEMVAALAVRDESIARLQEQVAANNREAIRQHQMNIKMETSKAFRMGMFLTWPARTMRSKWSAKLGH